MLISPLLIVVAYLFGSIPVGVIVGRARGFDPRKVGSGNVGMTNVARSGGVGAAAITFVGDILKGFVPVMIARAAGLDTAGLAMVGFAALLGAVFSIFLRFEGGRGVSTSLGVWLGLGPSPLLVAIAVFAVAFAARRIMSLASISAAITLPIAVALMSYPGQYVALAAAMSALVLWRHRENIGRLMRGQEPTFKLGGRARSEEA
ncbi:MAG: glycerol-3-phosphate 1-O-acyltransferase PlsY [Candidatus Binataceae bacterium]|jgi:glycerol-3-phosphate acyltransferase PlsY